jgi:hypothetical protein
MKQSSKHKIENAMFSPSSYIEPDVHTQRKGRFSVISNVSRAAAHSAEANFRRYPNMCIKTKIHYIS